MPKYQLLPPLGEDEFNALREDIAAAGIRVPIDIDEDGEVLDGHHRKAIAIMLGIDCPERVVRGLEEFQKVDYALTVNMARRHLGREERRELVKKSLIRDPKLADREHARRCGVHHDTVGRIRADLVLLNKLAPAPRRTGADGKERQLADSASSKTAAEAASRLADEVPQHPGTDHQGDTSAAGTGATTQQGEADHPVPAVTPEAPEPTEVPPALGDEDDADMSSSDATPPAPSGQREDAGDETGEEMPSNPVDGQEQQDVSGVVAPAAPGPERPEELTDDQGDEGGEQDADALPPAPIPHPGDPAALIAWFADRFDEVDADATGPLLPSDDLALISASLNRIVHVVNRLTDWHERTQT